MEVVSGVMKREHGGYGGMEVVCGVMKREHVATGGMEVVCGVKVSNSNEDSNA